MTFYDDPNNVKQYIDMAEGYDGLELITVLRDHLPDGSTILELGMGPGTDLDILRKYYKVTGSDRSPIFIDRYRESHPEATLLQLDAVQFEIEQRFDGIYSNKVLMHLTRDEMRDSFVSQRKHLENSGLLMHSFWYGEGEDVTQGLLSVYYTEDSLLETIGGGFEVVAIKRYSEMEENDSLYTLLRATE